MHCKNIASQKTTIHHRHDANVGHNVAVLLCWQFEHIKGYNAEHTLEYTYRNTWREKHSKDDSTVQLVFLK